MLSQSIVCNTVQAMLIRTFVRENFAIGVYTYYTYKKRLNPNTLEIFSPFLDFFMPKLLFLYVKSTRY
jgi:hypothetical protein